MKAISKVLTVALALSLATIYAVTSLDAQDVSVAIPESAEYPVLLVHGLGGGPGEATFGQLEEYLESFYFDVEVMDFDETRIADLNDHDAVDNLAALAAVLGRKVKEMKDQYNVEKVNIIAHSYGGLIVQAYLLDRGAAMNSNFGTFEFDVHKVMYLATPFYGSTADADLLETLVEDTDYGPYTRQGQMLVDLEPGSNTLFGLDATLRSYNIYAFDVEVATIVSEDDEVVGVRSGTLGHFTGDFYPFKRYRNLKGYNHAYHPQSGADKKNRQSLAYIDNPADATFVAMVSYLDDGLSWRKLRVRMPVDGLVMVAHNGKNLSGDEATLTYNKKLKGFAKGQKISKGDTVEPYFNEQSGVFVFSGLANGEYNLRVKNGNKATTETVTVVSAGKDMSVPSFSYNFRRNELNIGDGTEGKLNGIYTVSELKYTSNNKEQKVDSVPDLDPAGFEVSCIISGANMDTFDKGRVFIFYNKNGSKARDWNQNGGRLEVQIRGRNVHNGDFQHVGKIALLACVDNNKNGELEHGLLEDHEIKSLRTYDWSKLHQIRMTAEYRKSNNTTLFTLYVDGTRIDSFDLRGKYYNPNPIISFGGKRFDLDYFAPKGLTISDFVIRNLDN